ncbi:hypothetical protein STRMOE7_09660 [Streptomyces sp. MOE7]|nr:hypothetical protein STRMOE7_09660 [Streptomyces sp. MOE7]
MLLTGIHLMDSGRVLPHLPTLVAELAAPAYVPELIAAKAAAEHGPAGDAVDPVRRAAASAERRRPPGPEEEVRHPGPVRLGRQR